MKRDDELNQSSSGYQARLSDVTAQYYQDYQSSASGYVCSYCGIWVSYSGTAIHSCQRLSYPFCPNWIYGSSENSTEKAFKILKILLKEQIIKESESFKEFCELLEKIAEVI